jgi:serine/threonine protein kinase
VINQNELPHGYELLRLLGRGGNAKVGLVSYKKQEYALKLLENYKKPNSPTYKRFANEICALQRLHSDVGVMPVIDINLPERPAKTDRPWFTMPVATPIANALQEIPSLRSYIEAIADIASTLVRLKERNFGHRDIKPDNLFNLSGRWVIGDFGLATFPDSIEGVTEQEGRPLGSRQFMAPEMSTNAVNVSPFPADVWSLAKTLWSIATRNPFPSYLPFDVSKDGLAAYGIIDTRSHLIDRLLEHATMRAPNDRISIEDFSNELQQWLRLDNEQPAELDVSDLAAKMRILIRPTIDRRHSKIDSIESAKEMIDSISPRFKDLRESLAEKYGKKVSDTGFVDEVRFNDAGSVFQFCDFNKRDGLACREAYFSLNATIPASYQLRCTVMIQVMPDLQHRLYAQLVTNANGKTELFWESHHIVAHGMPQEHALLNELIDKMTQSIRPSLIRLNELIESGVE